MIMKNTIKFFATVTVATLMFTACNKNNDDVAESNDNEVITTVEVHLTKTGSSTAQIFKWEDLDGDGGASPLIQDIIVAPNSTYNATIYMLDKTKSPVDTVSNEIREEGNVHRFYFVPAAGSNITVGNLGLDENATPLGLESVWTTGAATTTGSMNIILRHYANGGKLAADMVNDAKSSTDADITFLTKVQ